jgi:hypothetical protein
MNATSLSRPVPAGRTEKARPSASSACCCATIPSWNRVLLPDSTIAAVALLSPYATTCTPILDVGVPSAPAGEPENDTIPNSPPTAYPSAPRAGPTPVLMPQIRPSRVSTICPCDSTPTASCSAPRPA